MKVLISIASRSYWRTTMDAQGQVHQGWGEFATESLDTIEKAAREKANDK